MIITDDKGVEHHGFKKLLEQPWERMSLWVSGGTDSAFGFWFMSKMLTEHPELNKTITPVYIDVLPDKYGFQAFNYINDFVREEFPDAPIEETLIFEHQPSPIYSKADRMNAIREELYEKHNIDMDIGFVTAVDKDFSPPIDKERLVDVEKRKSLASDKLFSPPRTPLHTIDKKGLAEQYRKYDLMESLYPYTKSCTATTRLPCGECFWCHEKAWAFGTMDKGIKL